jgi:plastocyanin
MQGAILRSVRTIEEEEEMPLRRFRTVLIVATLAALGVTGYALANGVGIVLTAAGPQPTAATVNWGDTVTFSNADSVAHTVTFSRSSLPSATVAAAAATTYVMTGRAGGYSYREVGTKTSGKLTLIVAGALTLSAKHLQLVYGHKLSLLGTVSIPASEVLLQSRGADRSWNTLATVAPGPAGDFTFALVLKHRAVLRGVAADGQLRSRPISVTVQPALHISTSASRIAGGHSVTIRGRVAPKQGARFIRLEAFVPARHVWHLLDELRPRQGLAVFHWAVAYGKTRLRVAVGRRSAASGLVGAASKPIVITGTGTAPTKHRRKKG